MMRARSEVSYHTGQLGSQVASSTVALGAGLVAKQREKANAREALALLDKAIALADVAEFHLKKAQIFHKLLRQTDDALRELEYVITNFPNDDLYIAARQRKDEILAQRRARALLQLPRTDRPLLHKS